jgi:hypothetical protein
MSTAAGKELYELGVVARATKVPVRRLKSWCEQGILKPSADANGTGTRRRFDATAAVKAAILDELRQLLGRPGAVGRMVARWGPGSLEWEMIDRRHDPDPVLAVFRVSGKSVGVEFNPPHKVRYRGAAVVVDLTAVTRRVRTALKA